MRLLTGFALGCFGASVLAMGGCGGSTGSDDGGGGASGTAGSGASGTGGGSSGTGGAGAAGGGGGAAAGGSAGTGGGAGGSAGTGGAAGIGGTSGSAGTGGSGGGGGAAGSGGSGGSAGTGGGPTTCGGALATVCPPDQWCDLTSCQIADAEGVCKPRPTACTDDCPGVCGCDGKFYCNTCSANAAGVDTSTSTTCLGGNVCLGDDGCAPGQKCCTLCAMPPCNKTCIEVGPSGMCPPPPP